MSKRLARKTRKQRFNQNYFNAIAEHMEHLIEEDIAQRESLFTGLTRAEWKAINFGSAYGMSMTGRTSSRFPNSSIAGFFPIMDETQMTELKEQSDALMRNLMSMGYKEAIAQSMLSVDYSALELRLIKEYAERDAKATVDLYNMQNFHKSKTADHA